MTPFRVFRLVFSIFLYYNVFTGVTSTEYIRKEKNMLDKETSNELLSTIMERIDNMYSEKSGTDKLAKQIAKIAATVSIVALEEYEKLNQ